MGRTIGPLQTVKPGLYPRANFYLEKCTPYVSKQSVHFTAGDCTPKRMEKLPRYVSKQSTDCTAEIVPLNEFLFGETHPHTYPNNLQTAQLGVVPPSELLFGETHLPNNLQTAQPGIMPPSELLPRETHPHTYPNNANNKAIRSRLRRDTLRCTFRSRGQKEIQDFPMEVPTHPERRARCGGAADNFRTFLECFPQSCISCRELHILEEFVHSIYGRRSIPRQFLENYMLFAKEFVAQGWIVDIVLVAAPGKALCRHSARMC